jgi:hypothetical protein
MAKRTFKFLAGLAVLGAPALARAQTYVPTQIFHGDGAVFGANGLYTATQDEAKPKGCLSCHYAYGKANYLKTGHKSMLRKVRPGQTWARSDGTLFSDYFTQDLPAGDPGCLPGFSCDSLYTSGSTFDWTQGTVTPPGSSPKPIYFVFGGWLDPTQLNVIYQGGFTGEQWPNGNYDCAHCHTTGYRADAQGPEPTAANGLKISDADFSRVSSTSPTSSWAIEGITCERCHVADDGLGHNHFAAPCPTYLPPAQWPPGCYNPTPSTGTAATPLCLSCHRTEVPDLTQYLQDGGTCSNPLYTDYASCLAAAETWSYAPFIDHPAGLTFLNSPHARFSGSIVENNSDPNDTSLTLNGNYGSYFNIEFSGGCVQCHQVHESFTDPNGAPLKPTVTDSTGKLVSSGVCTGCHAQYAVNFLNTTDHKNGANTPYALAGGDLNQTCAVCHMSQGFHYFRISVDPNYSTFPSAAQFYAGQAAPNTVSDGTLAASVWNDVDITCGQCHVGNGPSFGLPSTVTGAPVFSKAQLAQTARCIHHQPLVHAASSTNGSVSPTGVYNPLYGNQGYTPTFTFTPDTGYEVHSVNVDGIVSYAQQTSYTFSNLTDCHHVDVAFSLMPVITASAGPGGTIVPASATVNTGGSATFTISPSQGYRILSVVVDGATSVGALASYTFKSVQGNHTIKAGFQPIPPPPPAQQQVTVTASGSGTVTNTQDSNAVSSGTQTELVATGGSITFNFKPATGFQVGYVTVNGVGLPSPLPASYTFSNVNFSQSLGVSFYRQ